MKISDCWYITLGFNILTLKLFRAPGKPIQLSITQINYELCWYVTVNSKAVTENRKQQQFNIIK